MKSVLQLLAVSLLSCSGALAQVIDTGNPNIQAEIVEVDDDYIPNTEADASKVQSANFGVTVSASFPNAESVFGTKLVNGRTTQALLSVQNQEPEDTMLQYVGGSLWTLATPAVPAHMVTNLTTVQYNVEIPAGSSESLTYSFTQDLHPQDLQLRLAAIVSDRKGNFYTIVAFNETVSVVEAPMSFFDPQIIFLYLILAGVFAGTAYFVYNTWLSTLFPQAKKSSRRPDFKNQASATKVPGKDGHRATKDPDDQINYEGGDGPAVTTKSMAAGGYDESWIPAGHTQRPTARRIKSGTPRSFKK